MCFIFSFTIVLLQITFQKNCLRAERRKRMRNVCMHASVRSDYENCNKLVGFCFLLFSVMLFGNNFPYISLLENRSSQNVPNILRDKDRPIKILG
ncbi:hypothetical protein P8452_47480 [Trifolium repens]|nr:hypothetical protein P8452_47480 [Trifolium repens]